MSRALNKIFSIEHALTLERVAALPRKDMLDYLNKVDGLEAYTRARMRIASAGYERDKTRCAAFTGNDKDVCKEQAKATLIAAQADAKADQKTIEARNEARQDKLAAAYKVAMEKCDAFAGAAKDQCVSAAKTEYAK